MTSEANAAPSPRYFFLHIMKTGGQTFYWRIRPNFALDEMYPQRAEDDDLLLANASIPYLLNIPESRKARVRFYSGHFPLVATELLGGDFLTMTMLRDPVDRTVSFLKHMKRRDPRYHELTLEQIYEDDLLIQMFVLNHQAKLFSLTREDEPEGYFHLVVVDDTRLERAKERLQTVDVIGFTERLEDFARRGQDTIRPPRRRPRRRERQRGPLGSFPGAA